MNPRTTRVLGRLHVEFRVRTGTPSMPVLLYGSEAVKAFAHSVNRAILINYPPARGRAHVVVTKE